MIKRYTQFVNENKHEGTISTDSLPYLLEDYLKSKNILVNYELNNTRLYVNAQTVRGSILDALKDIQSFLLKNYGIKSEIRDFGHKTKSVGLDIPEQFVD